mmetsp:Transcript_14929/g.43102  ORF Transcript_14929/g.43102 Transcript_14929/m.43102 type:complete len:225 (+) Transcript_14929:283-957(+)
MPISVTMPLTNSDGVRSYSKFITLRFGTALQSLMIELVCLAPPDDEPSPPPHSLLPPALSIAQPAITTSSGLPISLPVMLSNCTRLLILYVSQQTRTGMLLDRAMRATPAVPTLDSTDPSDMRADAPKNTLVTSLIITYDNAFNKIYVHSTPASARRATRARPSSNGRESTTITRNESTPLSLAASNNSTSTTLEHPYVRITSPSTILLDAYFDIALSAKSIRS